MRRYTTAEIAAATGGRLIAGSGENTVDRVSTDSRDTDGGTLFIAMQGQVHDGHDFIPKAADAGCRCFVVSRMDLYAEAGWDLILVEDSAKALVDLARHELLRMGAVVVGITGSTGKTTTKDMLSAVLSTRYRTGKTEGNLNTAIGIARSILEFPPDTQMAVLEMGTDHPGEIEQVVRHFRPHIAIITNIGQAHLENFGSREAIFRGKLEIASYFTEDDILIIQEGPDFLRKENIHTPGRLVVAGMSPGNDYVVSNPAPAGAGAVSFHVENRIAAADITLPVPGVHNCLNAALAIAAGESLGVTLAQAAEGLASFCLTPGRMELLKGGPWKVTLINDSYNASPDSMKAGLASLMEISGGRHVAILGDMLELGPDSREYHLAVGKAARELGVEMILAVGAEAVAISEGAGPESIHFQDREELIRQLPDLIRAGDSILVKGSRGMGLETVVRAILQDKECETCNC